MVEIKHNSLWIVKTDMPANKANIGYDPAEQQEKVTIKKGEIIEFRFHYGIHFRTPDNKYCYVTEAVLLEYCEPYGHVHEKIAWENKTRLSEILRLKLYTPVEK